VVTAALENGRRLKVVFVSDHFSTPSEPGILRTWQVAKHLVDEGDEVVVIAPASHYLFDDDSALSQQDVPEHLRVVRMRTTPLRRGSALSRLRYYAEQCALSAIQTWQVGRCDVVVAGLTPSMLGIGAFCAARLRGIPFVLDERDLALDAAEQAELLPSPVIKAARLVERFLYANAARAVTVTPGLHRLLLERGVPGEKLVMAPNGYECLPLEASAMDVAKLRARLGWHGRTVLLYAGGLGPMYDLDVVLDALARLDRDRFLFVIMGEGEQKAAYRERCEREKLPVTFAEPVPRNEIESVCRAADIGVVPLRDIPRSQLVLSNKLFDYLGAGTPVVVTGPGDMADLVEHAGAGFAVQAAEPGAFVSAIQILAADPEAAARMGAAGREHVLRSWTRAASVRTFRSALLDVTESANMGAPEDRFAEHTRIREVYRGYDASESEQRKRDAANPGVRLNAAGRWAVLREALLRASLRDGANVLDVGCGAGGDLRRIADEFGHLRPCLHGVDLLPERIELGRRVIPEATLSVGGAEQMPYDDGQFDVLLAATVFSSILDDSIACALAREMARVVADGGVILCYDVRYPNFWNRNTRPIGRTELRRLFPGARVRLSAVTLLPPLARRLGPLTASAYHPLHAVGPLRSHYLAEIRVPRNAQRQPAKSAKAAAAVSASSGSASADGNSDG
jgi:glycosyltransferase involved in cell wall biosynthesis/ubiquinone/menaquinone biosynthesis C-methylase UbiE